MPEKIEKLLSHKNVEVRRQALKDLRKRKSDLSAVISILIKKLEDEDWRVRKISVEMLLDIKGEKAIKGLINTLYNEDSANARNSAMEGLVALGPEATSHLIRAYKGSSADVRKFIIDILGESGDLKALPLLLKALEDKDENVRASAVDHLGNIRGNDTVVKALTKILKSGDIWVAYSAADALGRIGDAKVVNSLISVLPQEALREPGIRALGQIAEASTLVSIAPFLKDNSKTIREETVKAIGQFFLKGIPGETIAKSIKKALGKKASSILLPNTGSNKKEVRVAASLLLGLLSDKKAISFLLEVAAEEDYHETIVKALVFICRSMPEALKPFFRIKDSYQRRVACEIAGKIGSPVFFKQLVRCLKDEDGHVRGKAALALSQLNDPKAIEHIKPLLLDEYENIQEEAIGALSRFKKWLDLNEVISGLSDKNPTLKRNSALLLGLLREQESVEALGIAMKDSDVRVRMSVVEALGAVKGKRALKFLLLALSDESPEIRRIAAIAIGRIRDQKGEGPLILLMRDGDIWVRAAAAEALGNLGNKKAIEPLLTLLSDKSGFVRTAVIEALGNFKEEKVKKALLKLLNDRDAEIRSTAVESLVIFDGIAQDILPLLKDNEWSVRKKVIDVLGKFFKDESYAYLKEVANTDEDAQVRETAERYLGV